MRKNFKLLFVFIFINLSVALVFADDIGNYSPVYSEAKDLQYVLMDRRTVVFKDGAVEWYYNPAYEHLTEFSQREIIKAIKKAMRSWSRVCSIRFRYKGITMKRLDNLNDGIIVIGFWPENKYDRKVGDSGGVCQISTIRGEGIYDGYIALNIYNRNEEYAPQNLDELQGIITHEVGHLIGIGHSNVNESVMSATPYHPYDYQKTLRRDDKRAARRLYPIFGIGIF